MGEQSDIGWTHHTWNPWVGCDKVSPGCENCYMFRWGVRAGRNPEVVERTRPETFNAPLKWHARLAHGEGHFYAAGERPLVFTCSLGDWFHRAADPWRPAAWDIVRRCPGLTFQVLTKRHGRIKAHLPDGWGDGWAHVWLGVSVESPDQLRRARLLNNVPAAVRFISLEPQLERVPAAELRPVLRDGIGWVIVGGESGARAKVRPFDERWALEIVEACGAEGVPVFVKQRGAVTVTLDGGETFVPHGELAQVPPALDVRQYPAGV